MMKKILFFAMAATMIAACSKTDTESVDPSQSNPEQQPTEQPEAVTVSFAMKGEYTIEERPLSRAAGSETESRDLYGISIYYDKEQNGQIDDPYGYGLFDNVEDMVVTLLTGYKYKFVCSLVKEGKDKIAYGTAYDDGASSSYQGYGYPLCKSTQSYKSNTYNYGYWGGSSYSYYSCLVVAADMNRFVLGDGFHLTGLGQGYTHNEERLIFVYNSNSWASDILAFYPPTDRYYGETTNYTPKEGGVVTIDMKRVVFGVQFEVSGISDGSFSFEVVDADYVVFSKSGIESDTTYDEEMHTYRNVYACWQNATSSDNYSQEFTVNMTWVRGNNVTQKLDPLKVTFKRNVMTTVRINLNGGNKENSFDLTLENTAMSKDEKNFDVDAGDMTDTPVDPKP